MNQIDTKKLYKCHKCLEKKALVVDTFSKLVPEYLTWHNVAVLKCECGADGEIATGNKNRLYGVKNEAPV